MKQVQKNGSRRFGLENALLKEYLPRTLPVKEERKMKSKKCLRNVKHFKKP